LDDFDPEADVLWDVPESKGRRRIVTGIDHAIYANRDENQDSDKQQPQTKKGKQTTTTITSAAAAASSSSNKRPSLSKSAVEESSAKKAKRFEHLTAPSKRRGGGGAFAGADAEADAAEAQAEDEAEAKVLQGEEFDVGEEGLDGEDTRCKHDPLQAFCELLYFSSFFCSCLERRKKRKGNSFVLLTSRAIPYLVCLSLFLFILLSH